MRLAIIAGCVAAALAIAACGKSSKSSSSSAGTSGSATTTTPAAPAKSTELETYDFRFDPKAISGKPGQKVTLELKNEGKVEHNFSVASLHIDKDLPAGKKATVSVTLPKSGTLQFYCSYHKASHNMVGNFTVGGASAPAPGSTNTSTSGSGKYGY